MFHVNCRFDIECIHLIQTNTNSPSRFKKTPKTQRITRKGQPTRQKPRGCLLFPFFILLHIFKLYQYWPCSLYRWVLLLAHVNSSEAAEMYNMCDGAVL